MLSSSFTDFYDSCFAFAVYTACTEFMIVVKNIDVAPEKGIISDSDLTEAAQHTVVIKIHVASDRKRTAPIGYNCQLAVVFDIVSYCHERAFIDTQVQLSEAKMLAKAEVFAKQTLPHKTQLI